MALVALVLHEDEDQSCESGADQSAASVMLKWDSTLRAWESTIFLTHEYDMLHVAVKQDVVGNASGCFNILSLLTASWRVPSG